MSKGIRVEFEVTVDGCVGRNTRVCAGILEYVESDHGLGDEATPFLGGKVRASRSESGAKAIFE